MNWEKVPQSVEEEGKQWWIGIWYTSTPRQSWKNPTRTKQKWRQPHSPGRSRHKSDCLFMQNSSNKERTHVSLRPPFFQFFSAFVTPSLSRKSIEIPVSRTWHAALRPSQYSRYITHIYFHPKKQSITGLCTRLQSHLCRQLSKRSRPTSARTFTKLLKTQPLKIHYSNREWQSVSFTMLHFHEHY